MMYRVSSILKLAGVAGLLMFVGAARPAAKPSVKKAPPVAPAPMPLIAIARPLTANDLIHEIPAMPPSVPVARRVRVIRMEVTAYCPCKKCCGEQAQGITASGLHVSYNGGRFVAADTDKLPFGTKLLIPGYDAGTVEVVDRGGAIKGNKLDVFYPTHEAALQWGRQWVDVTVVE